MATVGMPVTRASAITQELRQLILSGALAPGTRLRQMEIADRFGVSSTPVREAFTALAREGLVRQSTHRGVIVFAPSVADIRENFEIRIALESLAAERAAEVISEDALAELDDLLGRMKIALVEDPDMHSAELNPRFHAVINGAAKRPRLNAMIESLRDASVAYHTQFAQPMLTAEYACAIQEEHEEIVAALRARSPKRAAEAVAHHIRHNEETVLAHLRSVGAATDRG
ncbi:GntR family transcriptional regulator [Pseudonocardia kujensis]|uniref:GntR family transcriptional regulator n=1 Tax=Pseudonocardia kujensis TaxID=1128675 RepID=UPI001E5FED66|nr:GntR family transcriptional regulator [Pseudonocardia kujensis]MCE0765070.1 GntR family transcriptional regulator [Pseudonocardia kujensis]